MRNLILTGLFMTFVSLAFADNYTTMIFELNDGSQVAFASDNLQMTVSAEALIVTDNSTTSNIPLSQLKDFYFNDDNTSVNVHVVSPDSLAKVYSLSGEYIGEFTTLQHLRENCKEGIYIVKNEDSTIKVTLK